ncbi:type II secretion system F family protein [Phycisphaerales bacterium AB-hyl4]|uniref:Type II secretion system F family protein n=1 Tax=Natronomicrosphaera hydrolytica TaxID=3242702 RepID=A0ABV4TZT1_9BACT
MRLAYQAYNKSGKAVRDTIEVGSRDEAYQQLRAEGLFVTGLSEAGKSPVRSTGRAMPTAIAAASKTVARRRMGASRRIRNLTVFTRQMHVLFSTGTPLVDALGALERQSRDEQWKARLRDIQQRVEEGSSLSDAMEYHVDCFDTVYRALIRAGESGGKLPAMLERLATLVQRQQKVRNTIVGGLAYPILLLVVSGGVLGLLMMFVLPRFSGLFESLDVPLPPSTQLMMATSDVLRVWWWVILLGLIAGGFGLRSWLRTAQGKVAFDTVVLRVPVINNMVRGFVTARIARLMGTLVMSHVPLLDAMDLTRRAAGNVHYVRLMERAEDAVTSGEPISTAFNDVHLINPSVYEAMRSGESTGQLGPLLLNMAEFLDDENEVTLRSVTSLLEPVILVVLGVLVGVVALSMFLPLFDLTASAGG